VSNFLIWLGATVLAFGIFFALGQDASWATPEQNPQLQSIPPTPVPGDTPAPPADTPAPPANTPAPPANTPAPPANTPAPPATPVPDTPRENKPPNDDDSDDDDDDGDAPQPPPPAATSVPASLPQTTPVAVAFLPDTGSVQPLPALIPLLLMGLGSGLIFLGVWLRQREE
jgi:hypothetical protein